MHRRLVSILFLIGYIFCLMMSSGNCQISDREMTSTEANVIISPSSTSSQPGETNNPFTMISPTTTERSSATEFLTPTPTEVHDETTLSPTHSSPEVYQESETDPSTLIDILNTTVTQTEVDFTTLSPSSPYSQTTQYPPYTEVRVSAEQDTDHFTFTPIQRDRDTSTTGITMPSPSRSSFAHASTTIPTLRTSSEQSTHAVINVSSTTEPIKTSESSTVISTTMSTESTSPILSIPSSSISIIDTSLENTTTILSTPYDGVNQATQTEISTPLVITRPQTTTYPMAREISEFTTYRTTLPSITQSNILHEVTEVAEDVAKSSVAASILDLDTENTTHIEAISRTDIQRIYWTKNEIIVVIVVMFVLNVFNLIVVVLCVMHIVNNRSQRWERPPSRFGSRSRYNNSRPQLECVRTIGGCDLATDSECKSEEKPLQTVSIISKDSGWCVPIEEQKKKDQTADTGV